MKDCGLIDGDKRVVISKSTAEAALHVMRQFWTTERLDNLFADDRSFITIHIAELEMASA